MQLGSAGEPFMWKISHPEKCGPLTSHFCRVPSEVRMNAPLRVPTRTRTELMRCSFNLGLLDIGSSQGCLQPLESHTLVRKSLAIVPAELLADNGPSANRCHAI